MPDHKAEPAASEHSCHRDTAAADTAAALAWVADTDSGERLDTLGHRAEGREVGCSLKVPPEEQNRQVSRKAQRIVVGKLRPAGPWIVDCMRAGLVGYRTLAHCILARSFVEKAEVAHRMPDVRTHQEPATDRSYS